MTKVRETKQIILKKLKTGRKTVTELSEELHLTKATVSQHLSRLEKMGAVKSSVDPNYRSIKYFILDTKYKGAELPRSKKYVIATSLIVIVIIASVLIYLGSSNNKPIRPGSYPNHACSVGTYFANITVVNFTGFAAYNLSGITDYVLSPGGNGTITYLLALHKTSNNTGAQMVNITNRIFFDYYTSNGIVSTLNLSGITESSRPYQEIAPVNGNATMVKISIAASSRAQLGTYWMELAPYYCRTKNLDLFTIGTSHYDEPIHT